MLSIVGEREFRLHSESHVAWQMIYVISALISCYTIILSFQSLPCCICRLGPPMQCPSLFHSSIEITSFPFAVILSIHQLSLLFTSHPCYSPVILYCTSASTCLASSCLVCIKRSYIAPQCRATLVQLTSICGLLSDHSLRL